MTTYLLSAAVLPLSDQDVLVRVRRVTAAEAVAILAAGFTSAVGHAGTATVLAGVLGLPVKMNRCAVHLAVGDQAIRLVLRDRLPEGMVLDAAALAALAFTLDHVVVIQSFAPGDGA